MCLSLSSADAACLHGLTGEDCHARIPRCVGELMHVTVCICTRNRGSSIATTLRSVAASTYKDFDAVIVDQSTTDETAEAVRAVIAEDERFRYLRSQAVGASAARNVAIAQACGPLIAFTDDDC